MLPFLALILLQTPATDAVPGTWTPAELERVSAEIRLDVEEMRGVPFREPVAVKLTDKKGFLEYALQRQKETESPQKLRRDETIAKLLGLVPASMNLQQVMLDLLQEQVGGFYDPGTKTFYLMDTFTGGIARIILAHELTHALDDQYFDLDAIVKRCGDDSDALLAAQAVIEGSGTRLMNQWTVRHMGELGTADLQKAATMGAEQLASAPPYLWKPLLAAYLRGEAFLSKGAAMARTSAAGRGAVDGPDAKGGGPTRDGQEGQDGTDGRDGKDPAPARRKKSKTTDSMDAYVRPAFEDLPASTEQILHPEKYWAQRPRDLPVRIAIPTDHVPAGWSMLGQDTLGELYLALLTTPNAERKGLDVTNQLGVLTTKYTNAAAEGWGGDRVVVLERGEDRLLLLVTAWDTDRDADEFARALGLDPQGGAAQAPVDASRLACATPGGTGFVAGWSPTEALVTRTVSADGKTPLVVVRVGSFARRDATTPALAEFTLPWTVTRPEPAPK